MYIDRAGTIDMKRVNFRGNRACGSGGMFVRGGSTKLVMKGPFFFEGNTASGCAGVGVNVGRSIGGQGGGLSLSGVSGAVIEGGSFSRNVGKVGGGGMGISTYDERNAVVVTSTSIMGCLFDSNNARLFGGGLQNVNGKAGTSSLRLSQCTFRNNTANEGGGAYSENDPVRITGKKRRRGEEGMNSLL